MIRLALAVLEEVALAADSEAAVLAAAADAEAAPGDCNIHLANKNLHRG